MLVEKGKGGGGSLPAGHLFCPLGGCPVFPWLVLIEWFVV